MEPIEKGEAVTLDDDKEYYVVDIVHDEGKKYIYLVTDEEEPRAILGEEIIGNGDIIVRTVNDANIMRKVMEKIVNDNK
ncbi:MAG: hypothetical protein ACOXZS_01140 [Bacilli bacterium]|jgi:hypothetical protein